MALLDLIPEGFVIERYDDPLRCAYVYRLRDGETEVASRAVTYSELSAMPDSEAAYRLGVLGALSAKLRHDPFNADLRMDFYRQVRRFFRMEPLSAHDGEHRDDRDDNADPQQLPHRVEP